MSLYKINILSKAQKAYFSFVSYEDKRWVHKGKGIIFDIEDFPAQYYFFLIAEHVQVYRSNKEEVIKPNANHMHDNNCSVYLYGNQCLSLS
jgi:hypothetical protein